MPEETSRPDVVGAPVSPGPAGTADHVDDALAVPPSPSLDETLARSRSITIPVCLVTGLVVGVLGTVVHRAVPPWGLAVVLLTALSAAVLARALAGGLGLALYGGALVLVTQLMSQLRPGDDAIVASDGLGYAWLLGAVLMCAVAAFLPARWFGPGRR